MSDSPSAPTSPTGCDGMFELCINTVEMAFILAAIIVAGGIVMSIPFIRCGIKQRRQEQERNERRQKRLESVQLQLRRTERRPSGEVPDTAQDAAGEVPTSAGDRKAAPVVPGALVRDPPADVDDITPAPPLEPPNAHVRSS